MPNWVSNTVHVHSKTKRAMDTFIRKVTAPHPERVSDIGIYNNPLSTIEMTAEMFSFWNIKPVPKRIWSDYWTTANGSEPANNWYKWNIENWGCKWDASQSYIDRHEDTHATIQFETPWGVPVGILYAIGKKFPHLSFTWEWQEEQGFGGEFEIQGEDVEETDSYDVPSNHAEMELRFGSCWVCEGNDDESEWFDDCPRESDPMTITIAPDRPASLVNN